MPISLLLRSCVGLFVVGFAWTCHADEAAPAPHKLQTPGSGIQVHYVRMSGQVIERALRADTETHFQRCRDLMHIDPGKIPDEPIMKIERHVYYARQATISYTTTSRFDITRACGAERRVVSKQADLSTPKGTCSIDFMTKRAVGIKGACHVDEFVSATVELKSAGFKPSVSQETRQIAGHQCISSRIEYGGMSSERCVMIPKVFLPYKGSATAPPPSGLILFQRVGAVGYEGKDEGLPYFMAEDVQENIEVSKDVFFPYLAGGFKVLDEVR